MAKPAPLTAASQKPITKKPGNPLEGLSRGAYAFPFRRMSDLGKARDVPRRFRSFVCVPTSDGCASAVL